MDRDEITRQGKKIASDLRDTVGQRVSENEEGLRGTLGKAARWVDEKTGGKYSDQIGKAETKVGEGIGKLAAQGPGGVESGEPGAPGASAGPTGAPAGPTDTVAPDDTPTDGRGTPRPPTETPTQAPTGDEQDWPRPPQT